jgi:hypothetical protein
MQTPGSGVGLVRGIDPRRMVTTREGQGTPSFEPFLAPGRSCLWCLFDLCFLFRDQQIIGRRMLSLGAVCRRRKNNRSCSQEINVHSSHTALDCYSPVAVRATIPLYSVLYNSSPLRVLPRYCTACELVEEKTRLSRILSSLSLSNNTVLMYPDKRLLGRRRVRLAENIGRGGSADLSGR